jgi:hypothetical protein
MFWLELTLIPLREEDGLKYYPDAQTKKLPYYAQFFNMAEMDSTFLLKILHVHDQGHIHSNK